MNKFFIQLTIYIYMKDVKVRGYKHIEASVWSMPNTRVADENKLRKWGEEVSDMLLFTLALRGRVPMGEVRWQEMYEMTDLKILHVWDVQGYYVGRAKAMKAYKTNDYKKYYLK